MRGTEDKKARTVDSEACHLDRLFQTKVCISPVASRMLTAYWWVCLQKVPLAEENSFAQGYDPFPWTAHIQWLLNREEQRFILLSVVETTLMGYPSPRSPAGSVESSTASMSWSNFSLCPVLLSSVCYKGYSWEHSPLRCLHKNLTSTSLSLSGDPTKRAGSQCQSSWPYLPYLLPAMGHTLCEYSLLNNHPFFELALV